MHQSISEKLGPIEPISEEYISSAKLKRKYAIIDILSVKGESIINKHPHAVFKGLEKT